MFKKLHLMCSNTFNEFYSLKTTVFQSIFSSLYKPNNIVILRKQSTIKMTSLLVTRHKVSVYKH